MAQATAMAEVESIVSAVAWATVPGLRRAVENWAELAGDEAAGHLVSAVRFDMEWVSVRVSAVGESGEEGRWIEWLIPVRFRQASQAALDHFAAHELRKATASLRGREPVRRALTVPDVLSLYPLINDEIGDLMPPKRSNMPPKRSKPDDGRGVPAPAPKPAARSKAIPAGSSPPVAAGSKPGPKPSKVAATTTATRSKPAAKPKKKPAARSRAK